MSTPRDEFRSLVKSYLAGRGKTPSEITAGDDYLLDVDGRIVQLRLGRDGTMFLSTMVFYNDGNTAQVLNGPIAEFNAYHLFAGAYCLQVDERSGSLYVEQELTISRFGAQALRRHMEEFVVRAVNCSRWYLRELDEFKAGGMPEGAVFA